ncbi:malate/lactate/ureidoglycolate dehydrogenase [Geopsychrobacter electrodiphilus]|uniref:malate/lactate/ureidoglycolate dehydrogenase n=1 Tax=Geopsychrobacter electrodiphilus TaxID=225196 RepID=UPI0003726BB3|nr:malate/lactate/ureidoglycolate dehydrogenase [Geopsychrobacter electrodiphilus]
MTLSHEKLEELAFAILEAAGSAPLEARTVAAHLLQANLSGHDSHGVGMLPTYVTNIAKGLLRPNSPLETVSDQGNFLLFDGQRGYGQVAAKSAMERGIARCKENGLVLLGLRNAHHIGRVGSYGEQSLAAGLISLHFVNVADHAPLVAPFGGKIARYGTNPLCIAVPAPNPDDHLLLDMATSKIALGKARVANNKGQQVPKQSLIDTEGRPTRDPSVMFSEPPGALLPFGEHKGYVLGLLCEVLVTALTGGPSIQPGNRRGGGIINHMLTILIDPAIYGEQEAIRQEISALIAYIRATPPAQTDCPVMVPGDPERQRRAIRRSTGIVIEKNTWTELVEAALSVGLNLDDLNLTEPQPSP